MKFSFAHFLIVSQCLFFFTLFLDFALALAESVKKSCLGHSHVHQEKKLLPTIYHSSRVQREEIPSLLVYTLQENNNIYGMCLGHKLAPLLRGTWQGNKGLCTHIFICNKKVCLCPNWQSF